jgi:hypothetical protein
MEKGVNVTPLYAINYILICSTYETVAVILDDFMCITKKIREDLYSIVVLPNRQRQSQKIDKARAKSQFCIEKLVCTTLII